LIYVCGCVAVACCLVYGYVTRCAYVVPLRYAFCWITLRLRCITVTHVVTVYLPITPACILPAIWLHYHTHPLQLQLITHTGYVTLCHTLLEGTTHTDYLPGLVVTHVVLGGGGLCLDLTLQLPDYITFVSCYPLPVTHVTGLQVTFAFTVTCRTLPRYLTGSTIYGWITCYADCATHICTRVVTLRCTRPTNLYALLLLVTLRYVGYWHCYYVVAAIVTFVNDYTRCYPYCRLINNCTVVDCMVQIAIGLRWRCCYVVIVTLPLLLHYVVIASCCWYFSYYTVHWFIVVLRSITLCRGLVLVHLRLVTRIVVNAQDTLHAHGYTQCLVRCCYAIDVVNVVVVVIYGVVTVNVTHLYTFGCGRCPPLTRIMWLRYLVIVINAVAVIVWLLRLLLLF